MYSTIWTHSASPQICNSNSNKKKHDVAAAAAIATGQKGCSLGRTYDIAWFPNYPLGYNLTALSHQRLGCEGHCHAVLSYKDACLPTLFYQGGQPYKVPLELNTDTHIKPAAASGANFMKIVKPQLMTVPRQ